MSEPSSNDANETLGTQGLPAPKAKEDGSGMNFAESRRLDAESALREALESWREVKARLDAAEPAAILSSKRVQGRMEEAGAAMGRLEYGRALGRAWLSILLLDGYMALWRWRRFKTAPAMVAFAACFCAMRFLPPTAAGAVAFGVSMGSWMISAWGKSEQSRAAISRSLALVARPIFLSDAHPPQPHLPHLSAGLGGLGQAWEGFASLPLSWCKKPVASQMVGLFKTHSDPFPSVGVGFSGNPKSAWAPVASFDGEDPVMSRVACEMLARSACGLRQDCQQARAYAKAVFELRLAQSRVDAASGELSMSRTIETMWRAVALPDAVMEAVMKPVEMFARRAPGAPSGMLMWGPPGTGKTALVRQLRHAVGCQILEVGAADLKGTHMGQTAPRVAQVWEKARSMAPCIMFIDECEGVLARRGGRSSDAFGEELLQAFISEWDGMGGRDGKVMVIGATNRRDIIDEAAMSRFTRSVALGLPNEECRLRILSAEFGRAGVRLPAEPRRLARECAGMSGRDLSQLASLVASESFGGVCDPELAFAELGKLRGKGSSEVARLTWDDIALPERVKEEFVVLGKEMRNAERLSKLGMRPPTGALLWGPPGTGKTQLARVLAQESGLSFIAVSTADIKQGYIGQSGQAAREIFQRARAQSPCILFIDEIETVAPSRSGSGSTGIDAEIVGQLLQEMDGAQSKSGLVFVMCATNHPEMVDPALLSRLERKFELPLPDGAGREAIAMSLLRGKPLDFQAGEGALLLSGLCDGLSGRDMRSIVEMAGRAAVKRALSDSDEIGDDMAISLDDLRGAIERFGQ